MKHFIFTTVKREMLDISNFYKSPIKATELESDSREVAHAKESR